MFLILLYIITLLSSHIKSMGLFKLIQIAKTFYTTVSPPKNIPAKRLRGNIIDIEYSFQEVQYKIKVKMGTKASWTRATTKQNEKTTDVTEKMLTYAGPYKNFMGCDCTPEDFGYEYVSFESEEANPIVVSQHVPIRQAF